MSWENDKGIVFLRKIGITTGQTVLDFGARTGSYSTPAAIVVGKTGIIYAVDKDKEALDELEEKAASIGLTNIKTMRTSGELKFKLKNRSIDVVLMYDVLHYLKKNERKILYSEVARLLKPDGFLSVYPKHVIGDMPWDELRGLTVKDVKSEIQDSGFLFEEKICDEISHSNSLNYGCVLNFITRANDVRLLSGIES